MPAPVASTAGRRGALALAAAKSWFLLAGLAQSILLPAAIGQGGFGAYKRALAFVNVVNNVIVAASLQSVSRALTAAPDPARPATLRRAVLLHGAIGLALAIAFIALVPAIVAYQHAPQLAAPLYAMAPILALYSVYASLIGGINAARAFSRQAGLDATFSTLRTALSAACGWAVLHASFATGVSGLAGDAGRGALGAALGFLATAVLILALAIPAAPLRGGLARTGLDIREHLVFFGALVVAQAFQSVVLQIDLVVLGRAATLGELSRGASEIDARTVADRLAGLYAQAQTFGLIPFQLLVAASLVLFPSIAASRARGDETAIARAARGGATVSIVVAGAIVAAIASAPAPLMQLAYGRGGVDAFVPASAGGIARLLALAHGATAIAAVGTTVVAASGRSRQAAILSGTVAACAVAGTVVGASASTGGVALGESIALGMLVGLSVGAIVIALAARAFLGGFLRLVTVVRVLAAVGAAVAIGARLPTPNARLLGVLSPIPGLVTYLVVLVTLGEPVRAMLGVERGRRPGV